MKTNNLLYCSHFLSSWGDRMWNFAVPLFLVSLESFDLKLPAAYGLATTATVLVFGPIIGDWIDRTARLKAVKITLAVQNSFVIINSILLLVYLIKKESFSDTNLMLVQIFTIVFGCVSNLASSSSAIIIQKDWVVVISAGDSNFLADLNSWMRRIDLVTKCIAPPLCGIFLDQLHHVGGLAFIASWNLVSMILEYLLLKKVYKNVPLLALKQNLSIKHVKVENSINQDQEESVFINDVREVQTELTEFKVKTKTSNIKEVCINKTARKDRKTFFSLIYNSFLSLKIGWKFFFNQPIALPCLGFSLLYLTVLGFGTITVSYAYSQCFSELLMGILTAAAALSGIIATLIYSPLRRKVGLIKAGFISAVSQTITLFFSMSSIFLDGSPFYLFPQKSMENVVNNNGFNLSSIETDSGIFIKCGEGFEMPNSFLSLSVLMTGVILARFGLWGFDLTITQLIQESVLESERGIFNGVHSALNNLMDLLMYVLVIIFPQFNKFGLLVIISVFTTFSCYVMYCVYAFKVEKSNSMPLKKKIIHSGK